MYINRDHARTLYKSREHRSSSVSFAPVSTAMILVSATYLLLVVPYMMSKECCKIEYTANENLKELKTRLEHYVNGQYALGGEKKLPSDAVAAVCTFNVTGGKQSFAVSVTIANKVDFFHVRSSPRMWSIKPIGQAEYEGFVKC
ncbi:hypothetical protein GCK32_009268 [Trichostrongylus colubriformis]|uniref:Uncharacterized protein n=1 Tax=Trichostrongylus colubriformis TaxID=6319 RepID=A0AAN8G4B0_TRICO